MSSPQSFRAVLLREIDADVTSWDYSVANLPQAKKTNAARLIKCLSLISSDARQEIILRFEGAPHNRVLCNEPLDKFLLVSVSDFRVRWPAKSPANPSRVATGKENGDYLTRLLTTGVVLNGIRYHFFGHSNSQLKSRSCFLYAASKEEIFTKVEAMGDFSKLKSVGKKAKRIGLLFSSAEIALMLSPTRCEDIEDVKRNDYIFTDGCGLISHQLARQLVQKRNIIFRNKRYLPSVFQIRYRGYKGILTLDHTLNGQVQVQFRESMRKFKGVSDASFAVVDYSKPFALGSLNDEVVVLLNTLGVSAEMLLLKQQQHLDFLNNVTQGDPQAAFQFLSYCERLDLAEKLLLEGIGSVHSTLRALVRQEYAKMLNKRGEQRCRILIPKSRLLFGVCDPTSKCGRPGTLKEGECFLRITHDGDGVARTVINTEVLVTRNPCLHPGDLQKFKAVDAPEFSGDLVDCIVFSTRGKRPSADLMSGGDLDGDKFFVSWDPDIIPRTMAEPAQYPGGKELVTFGEVTSDSRAEYFARYTNASLGKVKNLYMQWARLGNAMSPQCQQLNRLFSQCVDGNRIRIPENLKEFEALECPPSTQATTPPFILDVLHSASTDFIHRIADICPYKNDEIDIMELFLTRDRIAMSEFDVLQLVLRWCQRSGNDVLKYSELLDFSALTDEQQIWLLNRLPPLETALSLVRNGLLQSELVAPEELRKFHLDQPRLHWKPVFKSSADRMARFLPTVSQVMEIFHKKLIILTVDERLTFAIYVPKKIERASEACVDTSVRVFAFPHSQGPRSPKYKVMPTKVNYKLFCDEHVFQLYERQRSNTWIFLRRPQGDDSLYRNEKNRGDKRRIRERSVQDGTNFDCKASIALDKIGREIQQHIGKVQQNGVLGAEVYVISNRDVKSMRVLDEWLDYIDTDEVLPLFEKLDKDYTVSRLDTVNWKDYSEIVVAVVRDKNLSHLRLIDSISELQTIFDLLNQHDEKKMLRDAFNHMLTLEAGSSCALDRSLVASTLLEYLSHAVYLISTYMQSQTWKTHKKVLEDTLIRMAPTLLQCLVLLANEMGIFIRDPFLLLLRELSRISLQVFAELVELISLTVRSDEVALDLLLGILEPESPRLLVQRPFAIEQFTSSLFGIALDHIDEASSSCKSKQECLELSADHYQDGYMVVKSVLRVDSSFSGVLKVGDHVRLTTSNPPRNNIVAKLFSMDALVLSAEPGKIMFRCLHHPPSYLDRCAWTIVHCGSFVPSKTSLDAVTTFYTEREACCRIYALLLGLPPPLDQMKLLGVELPVAHVPSLNSSQNAALTASMKHSLTLIWGPPGTGKTHTIVAILTQLLKGLPHSRLLVCAPTHNAVDNLLRRFVSDAYAKKSGALPVRVSTQLSKVAQDLRVYTCDAMLGQDLNVNVAARRKAQNRIKDARLIFTTCIGAGLGLLRSENFDAVIVDEASQLTEPHTLVPVVKGCSRAILVGDHVQLRATVQKNAALTGYDVSLFERHYKLPTKPGISKVMLDTQYRMHRSICDFSSSEFYDSKLETAVADDARPMPASLFPWPEKNRMVWVECSAPEDLGHQSKSNIGQGKVCQRVVELLTTFSASTDASATPKDSGTPLSIAILTPYTRQRTLLAAAIPSIEVSSIDGFQGREADIIVFVTVRCNAYGDLGFLTDMRRLNVVMTRARSGIVLIGNRSTMKGEGPGADANADDSRLVWTRLVDRCDVVELPTPTEA